MTERGAERRAAANTALVAERHGQMVGYARKQLTRFTVPPSSADPEDVVQIALTNVLTHGKPIEDLRKYVFAVITNEVRHAARRYYTGQGYGSLDTDLRLENAGPAIDPCAEVDLLLDVQAAVNSLPPRQRSAMSYRVRGYTQAETAAAMGTSLRTVATHVSRARHVEGDGGRPIGAADRLRCSAAVEAYVFGVSGSWRPGDSMALLANLGG